MMGGGIGSSLLAALLAGGVGYLFGRRTNQQASPQGSESASSGNSGTLEKLQLLGELHDAGVLTDAEFEQQKQRILHG
jgi:hypothetical protein